MPDAKPAVRLSQVNIVVKDMDAMAGFYERLGVDFRRSSSDWAPHHRDTGDLGGIDLDLDSAAFASVWDEGWPEGQAGIVLGFRVAEREDVDRIHDDLLAAGATSQQAPYDAFFGARYAVVTDPDGNAVGIMSPTDPAHRFPQDPPATAG